MVIECVSIGGFEIPLNGQRERFVAGDRVEVEDSRGRKLVSKGLAVQLDSLTASSPEVNVVYIGPETEGRIDIGKVRCRVERLKSVAIPLWAANLVTSENPTLWRKVVPDATR